MAKNNSTDICLKFPNEYPCFIPAQRVLHLISGKWAIQIIYILNTKGKIRYSELRETLQRGWEKNRISDATLSTRLSEFVKEGLICREIYAELPPRVEYALSERGDKLATALNPLIEWTINSCHKNNSMK